MSDVKKTDHPGGQTRSSIVFKLNLKLVARLFFVFLSLDIFLCTAITAALFIYAEKSTSKVVDNISVSGFPHYKNEAAFDFQGADIIPISKVQQGFKLPSFLSGFFPDSTSSGLRKFELSKNGTSFFSKFAGLSYKTELLVNGNPYVIVIDFSPCVTLFGYVFAAFLIIQLIILLKSIPEGSRIIKKTLHPITELAQTARSLNSNTNTYTMEQMKDLTGKLAVINADRLDTRIPVDETQNELKSLAEAINGMLDRINNSYRSQIRFVSDASHELRTPISVIQGYINLLDRWGKNDEKTLQESIDAIKEEASNMKDLVEHLLFLARGDSDSINLELKRFDLSGLASEVLKETMMIDPSHKYSSNLSSVFVCADETFIKQALRILVDNAAKYTDVSCEINISAVRDGAFAKLTVTDSGIGIPAESVPRIFDRFYRADESRARATGGSGLGLSIAKWIAERHGGYMEVLSRENIGTRISIAIPTCE